MPGQKGFTIIEITGVIIIVGILGAIAVPNYFNYIQQGELNAAQNNLITIYNAQKNYYYDHGNFCFMNKSGSSACASTPGGDGKCANNLADIDCNMSLNVADINFNYVCNEGAQYITGVPTFNCQITPTANNGAWSSNFTWGINNVSNSLTTMCGNMLAAHSPVLQPIPGYGANGQGGGCQTTVNTCPIITVNNHQVQSTDIGSSYDCASCCGYASS